MKTQNRFVYAALVILCLLPRAGSSREMTQDIETQQAARAWVTVNNRTSGVTAFLLFHRPSITSAAENNTQPDDPRVKEYTISYSNYSNLPYSEYTRYSLYAVSHTRYDINAGDPNPLPTRDHQGNLALMRTDVFTGANLQVGNHSYCFLCPPLISFRFRADTISGLGTRARGESSDWVPGLGGLVFLTLFDDGNYGWAKNWGKVQVKWEGNAVRYPIGSLTTGDDFGTRDYARVNQGNTGGETVKLTWNVRPSAGEGVYSEIPPASGLDGWKSLEGPPANPDPTPTPQPSPTEPPDPTPCPGCDPY